MNCLTMELAFVDFTEVCLNANETEQCRPSNTENAWLLSRLMLQQEGWMLKESTVLFITIHLRTVKRTSIGAAELLVVERAVS